MLSQGDIDFIKSNRSELTEGRTESITVVRAVDGGSDPYTNEPINTEASESIAVVWKEVSTVANGERDVVNGVELQTGDVQVTFDVTVDLSDVLRLERSGLSFEIVTIDEKGIGAINRRECVARRMT
jgi:hypothetical protein